MKSFDPAKIQLVCRDAAGNELARQQFWPEEALKADRIMVARNRCETGLSSPIRWGLESAKPFEQVHPAVFEEENLFLDPAANAVDAREWEAAWDGLARIGFDIECRDPASCEVWQYMGSSRQTDGSIVHSFRHRWYTPLQKRVYTSVCASDEYNAAHPAPKAVKVSDRGNQTPYFHESDCGGAFDGNMVTSDADPGL